MNKKANKIPAARHPNAIGVKEGLGYMFGDIGNLLVLTFISTFLKVFYTDSLFAGFDSDKVYNDIAVLFLVVRLWDAINDPLWGLIVDAHRPGKDGKFRPYIKFVSIPLGLSCVLCFLNLNKWISSYTLLLCFAYISYILFGMLYTGMNIPYGSLASVITDDPKGRTLLSTFRSIGGGVGGAAVTVLAQMLVYDKETLATGEKVSVFNGQKGFMIALIFSILAICAYLFCFKSTKERVKSPTEKKKVSIKQTYGSLFTSLPFMMVMISGILISGLLQYNSFNQYLFKNYFGNSNLSVINTLCTYVPMAALILFVPKLVEKYGKKELCVVGLGLASAASIFNAIVRPESPILYFAMQGLTGLGYSFMSITNWAIVMDCIDYQEHKTGIKNESAIYAVYTFARKVGQTVADSGGMKLLKWTGYSDENKKIVSTEKNGFGRRIYFICTIVPAIVYTLILILTIIYPLSKKRLEPIQKELMERRGEIIPEEHAAEAEI